MPRVRALLARTPTVITVLAGLAAIGGFGLVVYDRLPENASPPGADSGGPPRPAPTPNLDGAQTAPEPGPDSGITETGEGPSPPCSPPTPPTETHSRDPGGDLSSARIVAIGDEESELFEVAADEDWYAFCLDASVLFEAPVDLLPAPSGLSSRCQVFPKLFDARGRPVPGDGTSPYGDAGEVAVVEGSLRAGTYYLSVGSTGCDEDNAYNVSFDIVG